MHGYLKVTSQELSALTGLPYIQQVTYLLGIRPHMDTITMLVGVKRGVSYQSLAETLYVEPHQGIQSGSPSRQQLRRVIKSLERAGLICIQSDDKKLVLRCLLATQDHYVQNKADTNQTQQPGTNPTQKHLVKSGTVEVIHTKPNIPQTSKGDTPLITNNYLFILFEKFWEIYPQKKSKSQAQGVFEALNPDQSLFQKIIQALEAQINHRKTMVLHGTWIPPWRYPANWLTQRGWEDELSTDKLQENTDAKYRKYTQKGDTKRDLFAPPNETDEPARNNVIQFQKSL